MPNITNTGRNFKGVHKSKLIVGVVEFENDLGRY